MRQLSSVLGDALQVGRGYMVNGEGCKQDCDRALLLEAAAQIAAVCQCCSIRELRTQVYSALRAFVATIASSAVLQELCNSASFRSPPETQAGAVADAVVVCLQQAFARQCTSATMGKLHAQMWQGAQVKSAFQEEYGRTSALVMSKDWNVEVHRWCAKVSAEHFLTDAAQRAQWLAHSLKARGLVTVLCREMRQRLDKWRAPQMAEWKAAVCASQSVVGRVPARGLQPGSVAARTAIMREVAAGILPPLGRRLRLVDVAQT